MPSALITTMLFSQKQGGIRLRRQQAITRVYRLAGKVGAVNAAILAAKVEFARDETGLLIRPPVGHRWSPLELDSFGAPRTHRTRP